LSEEPSSGFSISSRGFGGEGPSAFAFSTNSAPSSLRGALESALRQRRCLTAPPSPHQPSIPSTIRLAPPADPFLRPAVPAIGTIISKSPTNPPSNVLGYWRRGHSTHWGLQCGVR